MKQLQFKKTMPVGRQYGSVFLSLTQHEFPLFLTDINQHAAYRILLSAQNIILKVLTVQNQEYPQTVSNFFLFTETFGIDD